MTPEQVFQDFGIEVIIGLAFSLLPATVPFVGRWWNKLNSNQRRFYMPAAILATMAVLELVACQVDSSMICVGTPSADSLWELIQASGGLIAGGAIEGAGAAYGASQLVYHIRRYQMLMSKQK